MEDRSHNTPPQAADASAPPTRAPARLLDRVLGHVRQAGSDLVSVALGRLRDAGAPPPAPPEGTPADPPAPGKAGMLHAVAERLRGAADAYVAAKLDELSARVDEKLDQIEARIDRKVEELHRQFTELRDRELRHRLRLLKYTLVFTVLVGVLSLLYKWLSRHWIA